MFNAICEYLMKSLNPLMELQVSLKDLQTFNLWKFLVKSDSLKYVFNTLKSL